MKSSENASVAQIINIYCKKICSYRPCHNRRDLWQTLFVGIPLLIASALSTSLVNAWMDRLYLHFMRTGTNSTALPDEIIHIFEPYPEFQRSVGDFNVWSVKICCLMLLGLIGLGGRDACWRLRRAAFVIGFMYTLRSLCVVLTHPPNPYKPCMSPEVIQPIILDAFLIMVQAKVSCGDIFFSGHTIIYATVMLFYLKYPIFKSSYLNIIVKAIVSLFCLSNIVGLVVSSFHYSIDVLISLILTCLTWWNYHIIVNFDYFNDKWYGKLLKAYDHHPTKYNYLELPMSSNRTSYISSHSASNN